MKHLQELLFIMLHILKHFKGTDDVIIQTVSHKYQFYIIQFLTRHCPWYTIYTIQISFLLIN